MNRRNNKWLIAILYLRLAFLFIKTFYWWNTPCLYSCFNYWRILKRKNWSKFGYETASYLNSWNLSVPFWLTENINMNSVCSECFLKIFLYFLRVLSKSNFTKHPPFFFNFSVSFSLEIYCNSCLFIFLLSVLIILLYKRMLKSSWPDPPDQILLLSYLFNF